jgi:trimeric autotransporter adhesin
VGAYGGTNDADESGELRYVVVLHAGNDIDGNGNELNGISFFGTGSGTRAGFMQVHNGLDDGVEFFGGTTVVDHVVVTGAQDDSFDWGQGWRGGAQFVLAIQGSDIAERGIEADNDADSPNVAPVSRPTLANFTLIGHPDGDPAADGIILRRGTGALIYNTIVTGFADVCINVDDDATRARFGDADDANDGDLEIHNSVVSCDENFETGAGTFAVAELDAWFDADGNNRAMDANLNGDGTPNPVEGEGDRLVSTDYVGAFAQDGTDAWTQGWTIALHGNDTVWEPAQGGTLAGAAPVADGTCPDGTSVVGPHDLPAAVGGQMDLCQLERRYADDGGTLTLANDNVYLLAPGFPGTYVGNGEAADGDAVNDVAVTLVVEPGTLVLGNEQEALIVTRGSRIEALGTAEDPIVMTSRAQFDDWVATGDGVSGRGEWAGVALLGYAESNECGDPCDVNAEGEIGAYGGADDADDSGELRYVVIRHAGNDIDGNGNELNGLSMFGTGSGTRVSFVQVHNGLDDGIEFFGGATFVDHLVLTGEADDSLDWGQGWRGGAQFVLVRQAEDDAGFGIEADNDADAPDAAPVSRPVLANLTMIGTTGAADDDTIGILLRRGTGAEIWNTVVTGFDTCFDMDDDATFERFPDDLAVHNSVFTCPVNFAEQ